MGIDVFFLRCGKLAGAMREEPTPMPQNVTRRRFIKRSGGATVGTAIGLYALHTPAWASEGDDSSENVVCVGAPYTHPAEGVTCHKTGSKKAEQPDIQALNTGSSAHKWTIRTYIQKVAVIKGDKDPDKLSVSVKGKAELVPNAAWGNMVTINLESLTFDAKDNSGSVKITGGSTAEAGDPKTGNGGDTRNFFADIAMEDDGGTSKKIYVTAVLTAKTWTQLTQGSSAATDGLGPTVADWSGNLDEDDGYCIVDGIFDFNIKTNDAYNDWHKNEQDPNPN